MIWPCASVPLRQLESNRLLICTLKKFFVECLNLTTFHVAWPAAPLELTVDFSHTMGTYHFLKIVIYAIHGRRICYDASVLILERNTWFIFCSCICKLWHTSKCQFFSGYLNVFIFPFILCMHLWNEVDVNMCFYIIRYLYNISASWAFKLFPLAVTPHAPC